MAETIIVRAPNWLGDTVMALPALWALRRRFPGARITLVGRWVPLLSGQGIADVLLDYPRRWSARRALGRALAADPAEVALILPSSFESALAARLWRARRRLGFDSDGRGALLTDPVPLPAPRLHQVDEYRALASALGADGGEGGPRWTLPAAPSVEAEVSALLASAGLLAGARPVGLHLGTAGGPAKQWPAERFAALSDRLAARGRVPLLLGSPDDAATASRVRAAARSAPASVVGRDRPALLPRLLSRLGCLVSGDTGVAHLAAALGVTTVTLFGPTDPRLTAPRAAVGRVLNPGAPCAPCFLRSCPIDHVCLRGIEVDEVERHVAEASPA